MGGEAETPLPLFAGSRLFCGYCLNVGYLAKLSLCWAVGKEGKLSSGRFFFVFVISMFGLLASSVPSLGCMR